MCVCVCVGTEGGRRGGFLHTPACDSDSNTCWHAFFPLSLSPLTSSLHPWGPSRAVLGVEICWLFPYPTFLSLTHSPSLAPSTAGLMFLQSLGADEKKEAERECVCVCGMCMPAQKEIVRVCVCVFHITGGWKVGCGCHTSGRQWQNNISFCSTMEKSPKIIQQIQNIFTLVMWSVSSGNHKTQDERCFFRNCEYSKKCYLKPFFMRR